jgi:hypothetical protein
MPDGQDTFTPTGVPVMPQGSLVSWVKFGFYQGNLSPIAKLYWVLAGNRRPPNPNKLDWRDKTIYQGQGAGAWKQWVVAHPSAMMRQSVNNALWLNLALAGFNAIPSFDQIRDRYRELSDYYGHQWGKNAFYLEINPRPLVTPYDGNRTHEATLGLIKLLPAIPPSFNNRATCIIVSELFPPLYGDGYQTPNHSEEHSLYSIHLDRIDEHNYRLADDLGSNQLRRSGRWGTRRTAEAMGKDEIIKAFNDLAHLRGIKTGFRMPLPAGQVKVKLYDREEDLNWQNPRHLNWFIEACVYGINLGFDAIWFDSARHVGGFDWQGFSGIGKENPDAAMPNRDTMAYINYEIRRRTGRHDLSFLAEMGNWNDREHGQDYRAMGFNACTGEGSSVVVSNDNDNGSRTYETREALLRQGLGQSEKPVIATGADLFPYNPYTNMHQLMMYNHGFPHRGAPPEEHWDNVFATSREAWWHIENVNKRFADALAGG